MKKQRTIYFAAIVILFIICILLYEYNNGKMTDKKTISITQISKNTTEPVDKTDVSLYTTSTRNTTCITSKKAVNTTASVTTILMTNTDVITEVITQAAVPVPEPVNEPPAPQPQENQNDNNGNAEPQPQPQEPAPEPESPVQGGQEAPSSTEFQREVLRLVNQYRSQEGIAEMSSTDIINQVAQKRAEEISGKFEHTRPDGSSCFSIINEFNISAYTMGENIAAGSDTPEKVVNQWMNSPHHRENIMNPSFTTMGIGLFTKNDDYKYYWAQLFIG